MLYAAEIDGWVLATLCDEPGPWKVDELGLDHGEPVAVVDAIARLKARGLVLPMKGDFVIASAAGRYANTVSEERG